MHVFRKIAVCSVLASYLFANTVASSFHDHADCCGHSTAVQHQKAECSQPAVRGADLRCDSGNHCCHHHHSHGHKQAAGDCQNRQPSSNPAKGQPGGSEHGLQNCVVCDFLALAPLAAPQVALVSTGEVLPAFVVLEVLPVFGTTVETHLARGPPAA